MRQILFRGFQQDEHGCERICVNGSVICGRWVYGSFFLHQATMPCPIGTRDEGMQELIVRDGIADFGMAMPIEAVPVVPDTSGQFTALRDKNERPIIEHDLVMFNWSDYGKVPMRVVYDGGSFFLDPHGVYEVAGEEVYRIHLYSHDRTDGGYKVHEQCEVIGTVFDEEVAG